jgi:hypothetical protein
MSLRDVATFLWMGLAGCGPAPPPETAQGPETAAPEEECDSEPSRTKLSESLEAVAAEVRACMPTRSKVVRIAVTFEGGGSVTGAEVIGRSGDPRRYPSQGTVMNLASDVAEHDGTIAGTPAADCMVEAVKKAHTHSFCDVTLFVIYPFRPN